MLRPKNDIYEIVAGRQLEILVALAISWNPARPNQHIRCPYPEHRDADPSWRWDHAKGMAHCSCGHTNILGVVQKVLGCDWRAARDYCRQVVHAEPWQSRQNSKPHLHVVKQPDPPAVVSLEGFRQAPNFPDPTPGAKQYRFEEIPRENVAREHTYAQAGVPVKLKHRMQSGEHKFLPWYRVSGDTWQQKQPARFMPLPYVAKGCDPFQGSGTVYWCEGERDVDTLAAAGLDAFTFGSAGNAPAGSEDYIKGRDVIIPADNDDAGARDAKAKAERCAGHAASLKIIKPSDLAEHADITDWLGSHTKEDLEKLVSATPEKAARLRAYDLSQLFSLSIKPREMVLDPIIPEKGLAMLYASRGIGKTHLALGIAYAVAAGTAYLKWNAPKPRRVLLIDGEMPAATLRERLAQIVAGSKSLPAPDMLKILAGDLVEEGGLGNLASPPRMSCSLLACKT
jgi:hypothetical protein